MTAIKFNLNLEAPATKQEALSLQIKNLYAITAQKLSNLVEGENSKYQNAERDGWARLYTNAQFYLNSQNIDLNTVPDIAQEAWRSLGKTGSFRSATGVDVSQLSTAVRSLANSIITKSVELAEKSGNIKGNRNLLEQELKTLVQKPGTTVDQIMNFNLHHGW